MDEDPAVGSYVVVHRECPISYEVNDPDEIEFLCGLRVGGFEFTFDADSLRRFVRFGEAALAEMDARARPLVAIEQGKSDKKEGMEVGV